MRIIVCEDTGEKFEKYSDYMQSRHWKKVKKRYKESKLYIGCCEICYNKNNTLHLHHKTYKRVGNERLTDFE